MTTSREAFEACFFSEFPNLKLNPESELNAMLLKFFKAGRESMQEEAAKVCDHMGPDDFTGDNCAEAIREIKP